MSTGTQRNLIGRSSKVSLAGLLRTPERVCDLALDEWDRVVPVARRAGLLARLANAARRTKGISSIPTGPRAHLESAWILAEKHRRDTLYEVKRVADALKNTLDRLVLLKGAAYLCAGLPAATGRIFNDIDILVPKHLLPAVEAILDLSGWRLGEMDPYDERYYRRWMHQLPPLIHIGRQSALDVHHTIVPTTARIDLKADTLFANIIDIPGTERLATLAPADMILHSATHLFNEGEFDRALRDLDDINLLLRHFAKAASFWDELTGRARELDLGRPLYYALRYSELLLGTPIPPHVKAAAQEGAPSVPLATFMDQLFIRGLRSPHPDCRDMVSRSALWILYVRAHYLRMPMHLLLPHLARKAFRPKSARSGFVP